MNKDPTIFTVNAYSYNSMIPIATDPSRLSRVLIFPDYGWMVNRNTAWDLITHWPTNNNVSNNTLIDLIYLFIYYIDTDN